MSLSLAWLHSEASIKTQNISRMFSAKEVTILFENLSKCIGNYKKQYLSKQLDNTVRIS